MPIELNWMESKRTKTNKIKVQKTRELIINQYDITIHLIKLKLYKTKK